MIVIFLDDVTVAIVIKQRRHDDIEQRVSDGLARNAGGGRGLDGRGKHARLRPLSTLARHSIRARGQHGPHSAVGPGGAGTPSHSSTCFRRETGNPVGGGGEKQGATTRRRRAGSA